MVEERVPTGFVGKIIGRNFYNRESLVKNQRERRTLGSAQDENLRFSLEDPARTPLQSLNIALYSCCS